MSETNITVEIHALQPNWIEHESPNYRLYINDDLITERTWGWNTQTFIEENVFVDIPLRLSNTIRLDLIKKDKMHLAQFGLQNLKINGILASDNGGYRSELSFILE